MSAAWNASGDSWESLFRSPKGAPCQPPRAVWMKGIACSWIWWPGIDQDIEDMVHGCGTCQAWQSQLHLSHLHSWLWPSKAWEWIHVDFAGQFQGSVFLIVVDAYSKWLEVIPMATTTTTQNIGGAQGVVYEVWVAMCWSRQWPSVYSE